MSSKLIHGLITALAAVLVPSVAFAEGTVKVECWARCDLVNLGQICDGYSAGSLPVAVACDDTGFGNGFSTTCGNATCRPFGTLLRSDRLSAYCDDGPGYDATVTCRPASAALAPEPEPASSKVDDGAAEHERE